MNKIQFLLTITAFGLGFVSSICVNAHKKLYTTVTNLYYTTGSQHFCKLISKTAVFITAGVIGSIQFRTTGGPVYVFSDGDCTIKVNVILK